MMEFILVLRKRCGTCSFRSRVELGMQRCTGHMPRGVAFSRGVVEIWGSKV
jgi:hypothetical protein